jgi:hypothetical protein
MHKDFLIFLCDPLCLLCGSLCNIFLPKNKDSTAKGLIVETFKVFFTTCLQPAG